MLFRSHAPTHIVHLAAMLSATGEKNPAAALQAMGGASVVLATATSSAAMTAMIDGLGAQRGVCEPVV